MLVTLELSLISASLLLVENLLTPKAVVDETEKAFEVVRKSIEKKFIVEEKDLFAIKKILKASKLNPKNVKVVEVDPAYEEKERKTSLNFLNSLLKEANFKVASKNAEEYASKVDFASYNVDLVYLKGLLVAKEKYLKTKAAK